METDIVRAALQMVAPSLREIADELGVGHDTVKSWSTGRRSPSRRHLLALMKTLEARRDALGHHADALRAALEGADDGQP